MPFFSYQAMGRIFMTGRMPESDVSNRPTEEGQGIPYMGLGNKTQSYTTIRGTMGVS